MKEIDVVINQGGVKRRITGPFEMCLSREDAMLIMLRLAQEKGIRFEIFCEDSPKGYGWVKIFREPEVIACANSQPIPWTH